MNTTTTTTPQTILDFLIVNEEAKQADPHARVTFGVTSRIAMGDRNDVIAIGWTMVTTLSSWQCLLTRVS